MFAHLGALLLAFAALAVSALPTCTPSDDPPSERSLSLIPRENARTEAFAGFRHTSWSATTPIFVIDYVTVSFRMPAIDPVATPDAVVIFALTIGDPGKSLARLGIKILLAGLQVEVKHGVLEIAPVYATDLLSFNIIPPIPQPDWPVNRERITEPGDRITLQVYDTLSKGKITRLAAVRNRDKGWSDSYALPDTGISDNFEYTLGMVVVKRNGIREGWQTLAKFSDVTFYAFRVSYRDGEKLVSPLLERFSHYDMKQRRFMAKAEPLPGLGGNTKVRYVTS